MLYSFHAVSHSQEEANVSVSVPVMFVNSDAKRAFCVKRERDLALGSCLFPMKPCITRVFSCDWLPDFMGPN